MNERLVEIREAARVVAYQVFPPGDSRCARMQDAMVAALTLVDGRADAFTAEHDERTRDLETLAAERDEAQARCSRLDQAASKAQDERDDADRKEALALRRAESSEKRAAHAEAELEKTRALVDELRAELAAPTVQSEAVKAWLALLPRQREYVVNDERRNAMKGSPSWIAANVLDSISMQATTADAAPTGGIPDVWFHRAGVPTAAAEDAARWRAYAADLEKRNLELVQRLSTIAKELA